MISESPFLIKPGQLRLVELRKIYEGSYKTLALAEESKRNIFRSQSVVQKIAAQDKSVYGINTGFGRLANQKIGREDLSTLQHNLILSHCAGVGEWLDNNTVRLISAIKIASLGRGHSGVRVEILTALLELLNQGYYPCIPAKGSVGASGDLAPLAHLVAPLIGAGYVRHKDKIISGSEALAQCGIKKFTLLPLEGLSLLNGTQVSTALALKAYFKIEDIFSAALVAGALSVDALEGSDTPFDRRIHELRGQEGQIVVARALKELLKNSEIRASHRNCLKVQDPYSLRCQPQVMGACLDQMLFVADKLEIEANAVTNNPVVLFDTEEVLSGGNFHAEPVAFAADLLAIVITEIASLSERRISLMMDPAFSGLPPFLVKNSGLNSGFMIAHVTAAALVSENKSRAFPCSVDSIPTSGNQEDHVSMATHAAFRLTEMADNTAHVIAIELLAACQAIDFRHPLVSSDTLQAIHKKIRSLVPHYEQDRYFADDMEVIKQHIVKEKISPFFVKNFLPSYKPNNPVNPKRNKHYEYIQPACA